MPKARGSSSRLTHSHRTTSGGSSKVGLNTLAALTQKDQPQSKQQQQNPKRTVHSATDLHQSRQHLRPAHLTSNSRVRSKDRVAPAQRRNQVPPPNKGGQQQMQAEQQHRQARRPDFSIARSDDTTDSDDEWVSSESGAATPQVNNYHDNRASKDVENNLNDYDNGTGTTLVEPQIVSKMNGNGNDIYGNTDRQTLTVINGQENATTPPAEVELDLPRVETARPSDFNASSSRAPLQEQYQSHQQEIKKAEPPPIVRIQPQSTPATPAPPTPPSPDQRVDEIKTTPMRNAHSEAPSPTQLRQKAAAASSSRRTTLIRHTSTSHGDKKKEMPPHPLIRGQSYHGAAGSMLRPAGARLAPLTLNSEVAKAQLTASPSSAVTPGRTESPSFSYSYMRTPSDASTENQDRFPSRRGSVSSLHSIATLPAPASGRFARAGRQDQYPNRTRTLSTLSTSSSSAALAALSTLPSISRPSSPPLVVRFPAERNDQDPHDGIHTLLPPTYFAAHMPVLSKYNPLYDSWNRVMHAKRGQGR